MLQNSQQYQFLYQLFKLFSIQYMKNNLNSTQSKEKYKDTKISPQIPKNLPYKTIQQQRNGRPTSATKRQQNFIKKEQVKQNRNLNPPQIPLPPRSKLREQDLMTQSKIIQAKNGLQLLKKKNSSRGISRNKIQPPQQKRQQQITPKIPSKQILKKEPKIQKKQQIKQYVNPNQQIPIKSKNVDFEKMIEAQLKKQGLSNHIQEPIKRIDKKIPIPAQYEEQANLIQCSEGCGRKFNEDAIQKHEKVCKKVFQNKRKAFDSAAQRKFEEQNGIPNYDQKQIKSQKTNNNTQNLNKFKEPQKKTTEIPKWKLQSAAFRASIKQAAGKALTKEQQNVAQQQKDLLILCNSCGRRFNKNAAQKHIPFCQNKAKMMATKNMNATNYQKKVNKR